MDLPLNRCRRLAAKAAPWALGLGIVASAWAPTALAAPASRPSSDLSLLQKVFIKHAGVKTAHLKIQANLPGGWREEADLWLDRPGRLNFHSKVAPASTGETIQSHVLADGGKLTIWSSQLYPDRPDTKNVFMRQQAPPDVSTLDGSYGARLGIGDFFLRLLTGEPYRLATARIADTGRLDFDRMIKYLTPDELALVSPDGKEQDELVFDGESGLLKEVRARSAGQVVASGTITCVSVNQVCEPGSFDWRVPPGSRELKPPPRK